jgi:hypothetical protein
MEREPESEPAQTKQHWQWESTIPEKPAMEFELTGGKAGNAQITANGKPLTLTPAQQSAINYHQQRINAILLKVAQPPTSQPKQLNKE